MEIAAGDWILRPWRPGDEGALVKYGNNRNIWINLRDSFPHPYTPDRATNWVRLQQSANRVSDFAIANAEEAIGGIGFTILRDVHRKTAEVGYWLGEPFWGQGIATAALTALTEYAFANFDLARLEAAVYEWNPASARVLEKCGFVLEGRLRKSVTKDGRTIDQWLYALVHE
jgi:RimJ/RimL family protein N-acetyltransferase